MAVTPGTLLGRYRLLERAGAGGMSEVWRAEDQTLHRTVAVKVIHDPIAADPTFAERFLREARLVAGLEHPNILSVYDFGTAPLGGKDVSYLVMPLVSGGSLKERIRGPVPPAEAVPWLAAIAAALDHAHSKGILHRDVKPGNVLLDTSGRPLLADFGLARSADSVSGLTATGTVMGTPSYMAPEQAMGKALDARADQYALACIAFEMLTGRVPFKADTPLAVLHQHVSVPPEPVTSFIGGLPPGVDDVLSRGLSKNAAQRYGSCTELVTALAAVFGLSLGTTAAVSAPVRAVPPPPPGAPTIHGAPTFLQSQGAGPAENLPTVVTANASVVSGAGISTPEAKMAAAASLPPPPPACPAEERSEPRPPRRGGDRRPRGARRRRLVCVDPFRARKGRRSPACDGGNARERRNGGRPVGNAVRGRRDGLGSRNGDDDGSGPGGVRLRRDPFGDPTGCHRDPSRRGVPDGTGRGDGLDDQPGPFRGTAANGAGRIDDVPRRGPVPAAGSSGARAGATGRGRTGPPAPRGPRRRRELGPRLPRRTGLRRSRHDPDEGDADPGGPRRSRRCRRGKSPSTSDEPEAFFIDLYTRAGSAFLNGDNATAWRQLAEAFRVDTAGAAGGRVLRFVRKLMRGKGQNPGPDANWILGLAFGDVRGDLDEELDAAAERAPRNKAVLFARALRAVELRDGRKATALLREGCSDGIEEACQLLDRR